MASSEAPVWDRAGWGERCALGPRGAHVRGSVVDPPTGSSSLRCPRSIVHIEHSNTWQLVAGVERLRSDAPSAGGYSFARSAHPSGFPNRPAGGSGGQPFISYGAAHPDEEEDRDPDELDQSARMALEADALKLILTRELEWQHAWAGNPGFDLFQSRGDATPTRWCEVKAMTGSLHDHPVGLSRTQFDWASEHGNRYWLDVVERAGMQDVCIVRIQDPASKARTFTFDHGWLDVAAVGAEQKSRGD